MGNDMVRGRNRRNNSSLRDNLKMDKNSKENLPIPNTFMGVSFKKIIGLEDMEKSATPKRILFTRGASKMVSSTERALWQHNKVTNIKDLLSRVSFRDLAHMHFLKVQNIQANTGRGSRRDLVDSNRVIAISSMPDSGGKGSETAREL
jgi:hypothetical protein